MDWQQRLIGGSDTIFSPNVRFLLPVGRGLCQRACCNEISRGARGCGDGRIRRANVSQQSLFRRILPNDLYWTAGFTDWRPVSEFRVARKTEPILLDTGSAMPPAIRKARQRSAPAVALICICALALLIGVAMMAGKSKRERVPSHPRVEAKTAIARGRLRVGMTVDQCIRMLGRPARIERINGSKNEQWIYKSQDGPVILHFENGVLRSF